MPNFNDMLELNIGLLVFAILVTLFILLGCIGNQRKNLPYMKNFVWLVCMNLVMLVGEAGLWITELLDNNAWVVKVCCLFSFGGGTVMAVIYVYCLLSFVEEKGEVRVSYRPAYAMMFVGVCYLFLVFLSMFNDMIFQVDDHGDFMYGPFEWISWVVDTGMLLTEIVIVLYYRKSLGKFGAFVMFHFSAVSLVTLALQSIWYPVPELLACTLALILMFMLFYWEQAKRLAENERELVEKQMSLAISQIQPHFLYNTLSTIAELCQKDALMAEEVTNRFATYLRRNLEYMGDSVPVDFSKELRHVQTYLWIEKIRFQDELQIVYDIQTENFIIPALTVQPLVENAVKHGMMGSENVCTITIRTRSVERGYQVIIEDDGCGFDPNEEKNDGREHIGIESVRSRLKYMVGGKLTIHSEIGNGTTVVIEVPGKG